MSIILILQLVSLGFKLESDAQVLPIPRSNPEVVALLNERAKVVADLARVVDSLNETAKLQKESEIGKDDLDLVLKSLLEKAKQKAEREPKSKGIQAEVQKWNAEIAKNNEARRELVDFCKKHEAVLNLRATRLRDELQSIERQLNTKK